MAKRLKVAVVGSRRASGYSVEQIISHLPPATSELVSGGAAGIDTMAEEAAKRLDLPIKIFYPDYQVNGRLAPLIRNSQIVEYADFVLAFWDHKSRGTANTLSRCVQANKPFRIISLNPPSD